MKILLTGGLGYIGSHTCAELLFYGHSIVVIDNLSNSDISVYENIKEVSGKDFLLYIGDITDEAALERVFSENSIDAVIHFAGYKAVGESVENPIKYYANNVGGTIALCRAMEKYGCKKMVFSSSATVYNTKDYEKIYEDTPLMPPNPYGETKLMSENIIRDMCIVAKDMDAVMLRYFNPIGAHESGKLGEKPNGIPNNLMPYIMQVATGALPRLGVFGDDYNTCDGTGVRDYIHVSDLARAHMLALMREGKGFEVFNVGTGRGYSVLEVVAAFERVSGIKIPYEIKPRRKGDVDIYYAATDKAERELGFKAEYGIEDMCKSSWEFARRNFK